MPKTEYLHPNHASYTWVTASVSPRSEEEATQYNFSIQVVLGYLSPLFCQIHRFRENYNLFCLDLGMIITMQNQESIFYKERLHTQDFDTHIHELLTRNFFLPCVSVWKLATVPEKLLRHSYTHNRKRMLDLWGWWFGGNNWVGIKYKQCFWSCFSKL